MDRITFGKLVQVLRREHRDEEGWLWTQALLSQKTGLSKRTIERIEDGSLRNLDSDILVRLADALELTSVERKEFFFAAIGIDSSRLASYKSDHVETRETLADILGKVKLPAFINDVFGDIVVINDSMIRFLELGEEWTNGSSYDAQKYNIMHTIFSIESPFRHALGEQWAKSAQLNMQFFRGISLRYRLHPHFQQLLSGLLKHPAFKRHWHQAHLEENDISADNIFYEFNHPEFGHLAYLANITTSYTRMGELYTTIYIPTDQQTITVFHKLVQDHGNDVIKMATWPKEDTSFYKNSVR